jgi:hypothetical protein
MGIGCLGECLQVYSPVFSASSCNVNRFQSGQDRARIISDRRMTADSAVVSASAVQYFDEHKNMTLPGEALIVDVRPAFRKPLADVTPQVHAAPE